jgi:hypothetical protein
MRLDQIVTQLKAVSGLKAVLLALSGSIPGVYPAAYVLPLAESATANEMWPRTEQKITARFGVEYMVKQAAQANTGGPAQEVLEDLRDAGKVALIGWQPQANYTPIEFTGGRLVSFDAGMAVWRDEFTTEYYEVTP